MNFPIHDFPYDYWRFTPQGFESLLKPFCSSYVDFAGENDFPHTIIGIGVKGSISKDTMDKFVTRIKHGKTQEWKSSEYNWKRVKKLFIPPILMPILSYI